jgi:hypothetical protein
MFRDTVRSPNEGAYFKGVRLPVAAGSPAQLAKTALFASDNRADVRKSAAGDFFQ